MVNRLDINMLPAEGEVRPLVATEHTELEPSLSPDNRWLAYVSDESGRPEVYVRTFRDAERQWQISTEGGRGPLWAPNGRELYFHQPNSAGTEVTMMAVPMSTEPTFRPGNPVALFTGPYRVGGGNVPHPFDIAPDGQRLLMLKAAPQATTPAIIVIQNWFEELKRLVPVD